MKRSEMKTFDIELVMHGMANNWGFCVSCGDDWLECEPDTRQRYCPGCKRHQVYGAEELLAMGLVTDESAAECEPLASLEAVKCYCCERIVPRDNSHNTCLGASVRICTRCAMEVGRGSQPTKLRRVAGVDKRGRWKYRYETARSYMSRAAYWGGSKIF